MITLCLVFLICVGLIVAFVNWHQQRSRRLQRKLKEADRQLGKAFSEARRDMNKAAGQSWRNLTEGGPR